MASGEESAAVIQPDQFQQLMSAINAGQARLDRRIDEFRAELRVGQEEAAAKALKKAQLEKTYRYRRKGNEEQAGFNARVEESLLEAQAEISADPPAVTAIVRASEALKKGLQLLSERQKLIKITDRSEYGWGW